MKAKRIIASFLSGMFSLSMMHVNVGAQNSAEKVPVKEESIVVVAKEEETTKESTAKKILLFFRVIKRERWKQELLPF